MAAGRADQGGRGHDARALDVAVLDALLQRDVVEVARADVFRRMGFVLDCPAAPSQQAKRETDHAEQRVKDDGIGRAAERREGMHGHVRQDAGTCQKSFIERQDEGSHA